MDAIAILEIMRLSSGGDRIPVRVEIGRPHYYERGFWACPVLLGGLDGKIRETYGEDSMQALCLGLQFVQSRLQSELISGYRLLEAGEGPDDVDFPIEAYFRIGEPGAAPNGGPEAPQRNSGAEGGPPSVG